MCSKEISDGNHSRIETFDRISDRLSVTKPSASEWLILADRRSVAEEVADIAGSPLSTRDLFQTLRDTPNAIALDMTDYLSRLERLSEGLLGSIPPVKRSGRNPFLLAASSVYVSSAIISKEKGIDNLFTKTEFSREVGIAEYTLRSHLAEIFKGGPEEISCLPSA